MRTRKDNESYLKQEHINKLKQIKLYEEQDKKLINEMLRTYKIFHAFSTVMILIGTCMLVLIGYSFV